MNGVIQASVPTNVTPAHVLADLHSAPRTGDFVPGLVHAGFKARAYWSAMPASGDFAEPTRTDHPATGRARLSIRPTDYRAATLRASVLRLHGVSVTHSSSEPLIPDGPMEAE